MASSKSLAKRTHSEQWWQTAPETILRCQAHYKTTGERCRRESHPGTTVCDQHGALAPQVQAAAAVRLGMSADDAARRLVEWMNDPSVDMRERVKIAHDLLDRTGLGATSKHLVGIGSMDKVETFLMDLIGTPGMLTDPSAPVPPKPAPSKWDLEVLADMSEPRVIEGEVVPRDLPKAAEPPKPRTPAHIARALKELL